MEEKEKTAKKSFRNFARIQVALRALMKVQTRDGEAAFVARTRNLGHGGVCLHIDEKRDEVSMCLTEAAARVRLAITLKEDCSPAEGSIKTTWMPCSVKWVVTPTREDSPVMAGLEFDAGDRVNVDKVDEFIEYFIRSKKDSIYRKRIERVMDDKNRGGAT